jgi:hypothetical protein
MACLCICGCPRVDSNHHAFTGTGPQPAAYTIPPRGLVITGYARYFIPLLVVCQRFVSLFLAYYGCAAGRKYGLLLAIGSSGFQDNKRHRAGFAMTLAYISNTHDACDLFAYA